MFIPRIEIVVSHGGRDLVLRGGLDTGLEGAVALKPEFARQLNLPVVDSVVLKGFGGTNRIPIAKADSVYPKGSPNCALKDVRILVTDIPGTEEILLGEEFFKKFQFDINYQEGIPVVVACGERISMLASITSSPWFIPGAFIGGLFLIDFLVSALSRNKPYRTAPAMAGRRK